MSIEILDKLRLLLKIFVLTFAASTLLGAKGKKSSKSPQGSGSHTLHYGMAGCGGAISLFPNDTPLSQLGVTSVRSLPNVTAVTGVFSVFVAAFNGTSPILGLVLYFGGSAAGLAMTPTVGMTFGTSNCLPKDSKSLAVMEKELYLSMNRSVLQREIVRGSGEHLTALGWLYGCQTPMSQAAFAHVAQAEYGELFSIDHSGDDNSSEKLAQFVKSDSYLASHCSRL